MFISGLRIITDANMLDRVPYPRSPARARRRAAKGYPQHHRLVPSKQAYQFGDTICMHPEMYAELQSKVQEPRHDPR